MDLKAYLASRGSQTRLAALLGVQPQLVWQWAQGDRRPVPADRCPAIEQATSGAVACEEMRPDVAWHRVPDVAWPWHPLGRPLIDVARRGVPQQEVRDAA